MSTIETIVPLKAPQEQTPEKTAEAAPEKPGKKRSPRTATKSLSLFEHLVQIGALHKKKGGKPETLFKQAENHIDFVCKTLDLTPLQSVLLADILYISDGTSVNLGELAELMKCRPIEICGYLDQFHIIERKSLLEVDIDRHNRTFQIPIEAVQAIQKGECPTNYWAAGLTPQEFMERVETLCGEQNSQSSYEYERRLKSSDFLLEGNKQLGIVKAIQSYGLSNRDNLILLRFCMDTAVFEKEETSLEDLRGSFACQPGLYTTKTRLRNGNHPLLEKGIIENANHDGFAQRESFCLTAAAKEKLLAEYESLLVGKKVSGLTEAAAIVEKQLFYPVKTDRSIRELSDLLQEENWRCVRESLSEKGMRTGFACLFSGGPGTGKTETAMQIAKMTGRGIMQVDISDTKSMWFGESEKKIKAVFKRYRNAVKCCDITPILLFNEADAVISKRQHIGETRNGPAQTENAIQNIILQEIENLDGILIATTNLTQNMDKAFERRFLYKIEFEKPTLGARKSIWQTMIPELPVEDVDELSERFEFSGGQIENISRRRTVASVLHGKFPSLEELIAYCRDEQNGNDSTKRIGFV